MRFYALTVSGGVNYTSLAQIPGIANDVSNVQQLTSLAGQPVPAALAAISGAAISGSQWCSVVDAENDPSALDIELDLQIAPGSQLLGGYVKIYGIQQNLISQSSYFTGCQIAIYGGFTDGLPLANAQMAHQGLLCNALIFPGVSEWTGTELSLTFFLKPNMGNSGGPTKPVNIIHNMPKGTPLSQAIYQALYTAFPGVPVNAAISPNLTLNYDDKGFYQSLEQYMDYVKTLSHSILGTPYTSGYQGVMADSSKGFFSIFDGTAPAGSIQILFVDLIGQPCWIGPNKIQFKVALRSDISPNTKVTLPTNILTSASETGGLTFTPGLPFNAYQHGNVLTFQGTFTVVSVRHMGRFRSPAADQNWITVIEAVTSGSSQDPIAPVLNSSGIQTFIPSGAAPGSGGGIGQN
jgi:hypothetical protein